MPKWGGEVSPPFTEEFLSWIAIDIFGLKIILQLLAVYLFPFLAMAMFTSWWSALILVIGITIFCLSIKEHHKEYDDRLSNERMMQAIEQYIKEVKNRK